VSSLMLCEMALSMQAGMNTIIGPACWMHCVDPELAFPHPAFSLAPTTLNDRQEQQ
jgi:hypothetical protein